MWWWKCEAKTKFHIGDLSTPALATSTSGIRGADSWGRSRCHCRRRSAPSIVAPLSVRPSFETPVSPPPAGSPPSPLLHPRPPLHHTSSSLTPNISHITLCPTFPTFVYSFVRLSSLSYYSIITTKFKRQTDVRIQNLLKLLNLIGFGHWSINWLFVRSIAANIDYEIISLYGYFFAYEKKFK